MKNVYQTMLALATTILSAAQIIAQTLFADHHQTQLRL
jgi:hypothetical protein